MDFLNSINKNRIEFLITLICVILILGIPPFGVYAAFMIVIAGLVFGANRKELLRSIGLFRPQGVLPMFFLTAFMGLVIELTMEVFFNPLIERVTLSQIDLSQVQLPSLESYLTWVIVGFVLGGFLEEVLFRGFLMTRIAKFMKADMASDILALFITAVLFGICHRYQGWSGVISTGVTGFILGCIFLKFKKNLWYAICTHGFVNLTALTILYLGHYDFLRSLFWG